MIAFPKPKPKLLDKRKAKADVDKRDREERAKCKARSGGRCEVIEAHPNSWNPGHSWTLKRCARRASHNHHLIAGIGRRNVGKSQLAAHRIDVCDLCHQEIHGHVLKPVSAKLGESADLVRYERIGK